MAMFHVATLTCILETIMQPVRTRVQDCPTAVTRMFVLVELGESNSNKDSIRFGSAPSNDLEGFD